LDFWRPAPKFCPWFAVSLALVSFALLAGHVPADEPRALDPRLVLERIAAEPEIVTPTGIAVDGRGRVLVIESHTHFRPSDYEGPKADRIRLLEDRDGDGRGEPIRTFFEGTHATMNLAVYRDGAVYVATRAEILRLRDLDDDGAADQAQRLAWLETEADYPHNGLSGFAFDTQGRVYFGCGENKGARYRLVGTDGSVLIGGGDGGNIFRCQPDGSQLTRVATGFWNPFHLCFDAFGRLFAVDNDPDSRPPCRLLHIVPGADFGYRYRNGRRGLHPFTAWNGELPGTLPMVAGTGEAPSGIVAYEAEGLPREYRGQLLVTSWGDHRIDAFRLIEHGASYRAERTTLVTGGEDFRPVGIALAPDGSLYISDWVDKSYELHRKGRVWRLRGVSQSRATPPRGSLNEPLDRGVAARLDARLQSQHESAPLDPALRAAVYLRWMLAQPTPTDWLIWYVNESDAQLRRILVERAPSPLREMLGASSEEAPVVKAAALRRQPADDELEAWWQAAADLDPFIAQAAQQGLRRLSPGKWLAQIEHQNPRRRLAALLLLRDDDAPECRQALDGLLADADERIRFAAVQWVAESNLPVYRPRLESMLAAGGTSPEIFEAILAALERLDGVTRQPSDEQSGEQYVLQLLFAPQTPSDVRRRSLRAIRAGHDQLSPGKLWPLALGADPALRREIVSTLQLGGHTHAGKLLAQVAADRREPAEVRAAAVPALSAEQKEHHALLMQLAHDPEPAVCRQALRSLRGCFLREAELAELRDLAQRADSAIQELVAILLRPPMSITASSAPGTETWLHLLDRPADPAEGERVFFHPKGPQCFQCHRVDGRGGQAGPDLSTTGRVLDRRRLIESIVAPSKEIAPQFVTWQVQGKDGRVRQGVLITESADGEQTYADAQGNLFAMRAQQIEARWPLDQSIMPADLPARMTLQEFADLLAYLQQRQ
jgi:putative membrane-bound dehydrogenase-like protein